MKNPNREPKIKLPNRLHWPEQDLWGYAGANGIDNLSTIVIFKL